MTSWKQKLHCIIWALFHQKHLSSSNICCFCTSVQWYVCDFWWFKLTVLWQYSQSSSIFYQAILSPMTKPVPVIASAISFISYFRNAVRSIFLTCVFYSVLFLKFWLSSFYAHEGIRLMLFFLSSIQLLVFLGFNFTISWDPDFSLYAILKCWISIPLFCITEMHYKYT